MIPIDFTTTSPAKSFPGYRTVPSFSHCTETVKSALNAIPKIFPSKELTPEGISTATLYPSIAFKHSITEAYLPLISRQSPTPKIASTITPYSPAGISVSIDIPIFLQIQYCCLHSSLIDSVFPTNAITTE